MDILHDLVRKHQGAVVNLRRYFHTYPEVSRQEFNTQQKIMNTLTEIGFSPKPIAGTGVIAELQGNRPGKCIAVRADMDALEMNDECGKSYQSVNQGVCHACGHDGHIAMLLGVAQVLKEYQDHVSGSIRFLFQPAEENFPSGALAMIEAGALDGVDAIIGAHLWQTLPSGSLGIKSGKLMASPSEFDLTIQGRGGHGSMPQQTIDTLLVAAQITLALNTIVSRNIDPLEQAVLSLGYFHCGTTFNVIPDVALLKGTVRSFEPEVRDLIFERIETIAEGICLAAGATYKLEKIFGHPAVINNSRCTQEVIAAARESLGEDKVIPVQPTMVGEDFSHYLKRIPGAFMFVGVGNKSKGMIYPQHHPKYDMDEDALAYGMEVLVRAALRLASK